MNLDAHIIPLLGYFPAYLVIFVAAPKHSPHSYPPQPNSPLCPVVHTDRYPSLGVVLVVPYRRPDGLPLAIPQALPRVHEVCLIGCVACVIIPALHLQRLILLGRLCL